MGQTQTPSTSSSSNTASLSTNNVQYYCINATWFRHAYPYLMYRFQPQGVSGVVSSDWKERLGPIDNTAPSSSAVVVVPPQQQQQQRHPADFVLVGANVWLLLSQKFGTTGSNPPRTVQRLPNNNNKGMWVVVISAAPQLYYVPIPTPSGRFPYEKFLADANMEEEDAIEDLYSSTEDDLVRWF